MNVLADRHHAGLYRSLQLLGDRLGWNLYTPVGMDWWDAGIWNFGRKTWGDDRLARQFIAGPEWVQGWWGEGYRDTVDPEFPPSPVEPGVYPPETIHGVTLAQARNMPWDLVIASAEDNQWGFAAFAKGVGARFVVQVGNTGQHVDWSLDPLALVSSEVPIVGRGVRYHQEMDPAATRFVDPGTAWHRAQRAITSFVNCFPSIGPCYDGWKAMEAALPEFGFEEYGIDGAHGVLKPIGRLADRMADALFGYHDKVHGDGFGHVIHGWAAVGRPLIGHGSHYAGKMAHHFWQHGRTAIDLDVVSIPEAARMVREIAADPDRHAEMCHAIRAEYERIDHAAEAEAIRALLGGNK